MIALTEAGRARPGDTKRYDDTAVVLVSSTYSTHTSQQWAASRFGCQCLRAYESLSEFGGRRNRSVTLELLTIPYRLQLKHRRQHNKSPTDSNSSPSSVDLTGPRSVRTRLTWAILGTHQKNLGYIGPCKENEEGRRSQMSCWAGSLGPLP